MYRIESSILLELLLLVTHMSSDFIIWGRFSVTAGGTNREVLLVCTAGGAAYMYVVAIR